MSSPQHRDTTFESAAEPSTQAPTPPSGPHPQGLNGVDWIVQEQQGGGKVPEDFTWGSNPKQEQEDGASSTRGPPGA